MCEDESSRVRLKTIQVNSDRRRCQIFLKNLLYFLLKSWDYDSLSINWAWNHETIWHKRKMLKFTSAARAYRLVFMSLLIVSTKKRKIWSCSTSLISRWNCNFVGLLETWRTFTFSWEEIIIIFFQCSWSEVKFEISEVWEKVWEKHNKLYRFGPNKQERGKTQDENN